MGNPQPSPKPSGMDAVHRLSGGGRVRRARLRYSRSHSERSAGKRNRRKARGEFTRRNNRREPLALKVAKCLVV